MFLSFEDRVRKRSFVVHESCRAWGLVETDLLDRHGVRLRGECAFAAGPGNWSPELVLLSGTGTGIGRRNQLQQPPRNRNTPGNQLPTTRTPLVAGA